MLSKAALNFLVDLSLNNDRDWFNANRQRYEDDVRTPAFELIRAVEPRLHEVSPHFTAIAKKSGGSLMRIFRDTRFSKNKEPYKTNIGIQFRHEAGKDVHAPGYYLHIALDGCFFGAGMWGPDSTALRAIRTAIVERPDDYVAARDEPAFRELFEISDHGESLKTAPRGFPKDHPLIEDLRRKHHIATGPIEPEALFGQSGVNAIAERIERSQPFMRFMTESVGLPF